MKSNCGDKTMVGPSFIHNRISFAGKMTSLCWIRVQVTSYAVIQNTFLVTCCLTLNQPQNQLLKEGRLPMIHGYNELCRGIKFPEYGTNDHFCCSWATTNNTTANKYVYQSRFINPWKTLILLMLSTLLKRLGKRSVWRVHLSDQHIKCEWGVSQYV